VPFKSHTWTYRVLQEVHQGVCTEYYIDGKFVERHYISVESGLSTVIGYLEGEDGERTCIIVSRLGKDISCECRCIGNITWRNSGIAKSRGLRSSYSL
jgi:hypothetical protein